VTGSAAAEPLHCGRSVVSSTSRVRVNTLKPAESTALDNITSVCRLSWSEPLRCFASLLALQQFLLVLALQQFLLGSCCVLCILKADIFAVVIKQNW